jgi:hypothetical protein
MSEGAPIDRPLTDPERQLLIDLAVQHVTQQGGYPLEKARATLRQAAADGDLLFAGDNVDVRVTIRGKVLVHCQRDWLAFHASFPGNDPWRDRKDERG